eukprot:SAG31_NODE_6319_length_2067_cov_1.438516_1_plen_264_part_00
MLADLLSKHPEADLCASLEDRWTLLHWAARLGAAHCASLLLRPPARSQSLRGFLDVTANYSAADRCIPCPLDAVDWGGHTALHLASSSEVVEVLLQAAGSRALSFLGLENKQHRTALEDHLAEGREMIAKALGYTPLRMLEMAHRRLAWAKAGGDVIPRLAEESPVYWALPDDLVLDVAMSLPVLWSHVTVDRRVSPCTATWGACKPLQAQYFSDHESISVGERSDSRTCCTLTRFDEATDRDSRENARRKCVWQANVSCSLQ